MSALCFWCENKDWLQKKLKELGTNNPVGECDSCSVHTCNDHGVRGTNALFVCLVCVPNQVRQQGGLAPVLNTFPDLEDRLSPIKAVIESLKTLEAELVASRLEDAITAERYRRQPR
jgi:hypothetical protein